MTLYQLTAEWQSIMDAVGDDGILGPDEAEAIEELEGSLASKAENIAKLVRNLDAQAEACRLESGRLAHAARLAESRAEWFKNYLMGNMQKLGLPRIDAGLFKIRVQRNSRPSVLCSVPVESLPDLFIRRKVELSVNCDAVLKEAKAGGQLPDGVRVEQGYQLRIG